MRKTELHTGMKVGDKPLVNNDLTPEQAQELQRLLEEFGDVLSNQPRRTKITQHHIETGSTQPIWLALYRIPHAYRDTMQRQLKEMLESGIIERGLHQSYWSRRKDGALRMCVDYCRLNVVSRADAYPIPRLDDRLGKAKYITTLDLSCGYWQVPGDAGSISCTALTTPFGLFQFRVMPFGLLGAPTTFQLMMDCLLTDVVSIPLHT